MSWIYCGFVVNQTYQWWSVIGSNCRVDVNKISPASLGYLEHLAVEGSICYTTEVTNYCYTAKITLCYLVGDCLTPVSHSTSYTENLLISLFFGVSQNFPESCLGSHCILESFPPDRYRVPKFPSLKCNL